MRRLPAYLPAFLLVVGACGGPDDGRLAVDFERADAERIARFYFGGYAAPDGADPFETGLLVQDGGAIRLAPDSLDARFRARLTDTDGDGVLGRAELTAFFEATYADARALPPTLDALRQEAPYAADSPDWFAVQVDGSAMTTARRRVLVPVAALRSALGGYRATGGRIVYPAGATIVGEHLDAAGRVIETTVKRRRADGFWDFAVYDAAGRLASQTETPPRPLRAPTQCVGCHLGRRQFEPEQSFPAAAPEGPTGPRAVMASGANTEAPATRAFAARFEEHARRSDGVLGLYGTLYAARLAAEAAAGRASAEDEALLAGLEGGARR